MIRTLLRTFDLQPTSEPDEAWRNRGVAFAPRRGGRAVVRRLSRPGSHAGRPADALAPAS